MKDHRLLEVDIDATVSELKKRWKELALQHHPDKGGDAAVFTELNAAYRRLIMRAKHCRYCRDRGYVEVQSGFETIRVTCQCKGGIGGKDKSM